MENQTQTSDCPTREDAHREVKQNRDAFSRMEFSPSDNGKFALLCNKELVEVLETRRDAFKMGLKLFGHVGCFSVQQIDPEPVDLGIMNYALHNPAH